MQYELKAARKETNGAAMVDGGKQKDPERMGAGDSLPIKQDPYF